MPEQQEAAVQAEADQPPVNVSAPERYFNMVAKKIEWTKIRWFDASISSKCTGDAYMTGLASLGE